MVVIIDYGMGNLGSVQNMFRKINAEVRVSSDPDDIAKADKLVLPGVGAFGKGIENLRQSGLIPLLNQKVNVDGTPILGICLGMQLFSERSEEGGAEGLGWIKGEAVRFALNDGQTLRVPHMGWNTITVRRPNPFWPDDGAESRFYFVHSYHVRCAVPEDVMATTRYGDEFVSAVLRDRIVGVQFHPEKSHRFGMRFLERFAAAF